MENTQRYENINIENINLIVDKWVSSMEGVTRDRLKSIEYKLPEVLFGKKCVCSLFNDKIVPEGYVKIHLLNRLGTPSMDGEVYLIKIEEVLLACKIMPLINDKSRGNNENEIKIATYLSDMVKEGKSPFFPIVYNSVECENTVFSPTSKFKEESDNYALIEYVKNGLKTKRDRVRFNAYTKSGRFNTPDKIVEFAHKQDIILPESIPVSSYVMLSELAWGDIGDFFNKYGGRMVYNMWDKLLLQMLYAVKDLHNFGIFHGDLHIHNFLIMFKQKNGKIESLPLIHDFGKSRKSSVEDLTLKEKKTDYNNMIFGLLNQNKYYNVPENIRNKLIKMKNIIDIFSHDDELINFWKNNK